MAEGRSSQVSCRYFLNGSCRLGDGCRYSHAMDIIPATNYRPVGCRNQPAATRCRLSAPGQYVRGTHLHLQCRNGRSEASTSSASLHEEKENVNPGMDHLPRETDGVEGAGSSGSASTKKASLQSADVQNHLNAWNGATNEHLSRWASAPEFVPQNKSAINEGWMLDCGTVDEAAGGAPSSEAQPGHRSVDVCRYFEAGNCTRDNCCHIHGEICELCGQNSLHPTNQAQRHFHMQGCLQVQKQKERKEEIKEGMARSTDKTCGVCFETVMEKPPGQQRFGILPNCNHCFCLSCIRRWRQAKQFDNTIIRACPECRVASDFVCPSLYWADTKEQKEKLIVDYKEALGTKDCKYFRCGIGKCPFGNKCFYRHAYPDGTKADVGPPRLRQRRQTNGDVDIMERSGIFWEVTEQGVRWMFPVDALEELADFLDSDFSDSDDDDFNPDDGFFFE